MRDGNDDPKPRDLRLSGEQARRWQEANADAIRDYNDWIARNGLPLDRYRRF